MEGLREELAARDVAGDEVAVTGVLVFEEVIARALGHVAPGALLARVAGDPHPAALASHALRDEPELVGAGDRRRVDLHELAVAVAGPLLVRGARGRPGVDHAVGRAPEDDARAAGREAHRVGRERLEGGRLQVLGDEAAADAFVVEDQRDEVPPLHLADHLLARDAVALVVLDFDGLPAAHLLVERVEKLLPGGRSGESGAVKERPAEAAEVEQPLGRPVEGDAHAVEHEDDVGRGVAHPLDGGLVRQKVAAVDGLFEVNLRRVAFTLGVDARVDAPLGADRMGPLDGNEREQVDRDTRLAELDDGHQPREAPSHDRHPPHAT